MNDPHNAVFPKSFCGDSNDNYHCMQLIPWLDGLFKSNEKVPVYMKNNPLLDGQQGVDPLSNEGFAIITGIVL
jgi:hypothetical protein